MTTINEKAAKWALTKVGYKYSQPKRLQENYFDCSSLVARAYQACGYEFTCEGAPIPTSNKEVYDDCFELLWPSTYAEIGKKFGGKEEIKLGTKAGDLQYIRTSSSSRANKITHIAMVANKDTIVHARGTNYGVVTNDINLYNGKICAITRYNPKCELRIGHIGDRVRALQKQLNAKGANLTVDGVYGKDTAAAVAKYSTSSTNTQTSNKVTSTAKFGVCNAGAVNIRKGAGISNASIGIIRKDEKLLYLDNNSDWVKVSAKINGDLIIGYMVKKYIKDLS